MSTRISASDTSVGHRRELLVAWVAGALVASATLAMAACGSSGSAAGSGGHGSDASTGPEGGDAGANAGDAASDADALANSSDASHGMDASGASEGGSQADAGAEGGVPGYHDITDPSNWSSFVDTSASSGGYAGAIYDGRYVYFSPTGGVVQRYDTQAAFGDAASWTAAPPSFGSFFGGVFDGRYLYLSPSGGSAARYDSTQSFVAAAAWSTFDTTTIAGQTGDLFRGAVFDGRYVYYVPFFGSPDPYGDHVARFDTQGTFTDAASWASFDTSQLSGARYFQGGVFDGRYVYFVPVNVSTGTYLVAYDTQADFASTSAWQTIDLTATLTNLNALHCAGPCGYEGAIFDGRYVYLIPNGSPTLRYDTTSTFADATAWLASTGAGLGAYTGGFDGRYVYFIPWAFDATSADVSRLDTTADFADSASWTSFTLDDQVAGDHAVWFGAAFDGRYLYLAPQGTTQVSRFDARFPPALPPSYNGSFF